MWYHYLLFVLGAVLSQFAEWTHLKVFGPDDLWIKAYGYAISIVLVEYACSVTANRHFFNEDDNRQRGFLMQVLWNSVQQITINLILAIWIGQKYNVFHVLAAGFLFAAVFCAGWGTHKQNDYTSL
jgi:uncharacterized protein (DUF486 family)